MPFAADPQHGLFYPINALVYALDPAFSFRHFMVLTMGHYWLASVFAYALVRGLGTGHAGAILSGIAYAYNGFMVAHFGHPPMIEVAAWVPLAALCMLRTAQAPTRRAGLRAALVSGVVWGIALLAGHVQIWIYGALIVSVIFWASARFDRPVHNHPVWLLALWLLALAVTAGVAAIQELPFLQLLGHSVRADLSYERSQELALHPVGLIQLLIPKIFGDSPTTFWGPWAGSESQGYAGVLMLVLLGLALLYPTRLRWALAALGGVGVFLALGGDTPLHGWAYRFVPGLHQARASGRALYIFDTGVALLAGLGLDQLLRLSYTSRDSRNTALYPARRILLLATAVLWCLVLPLLYVALLTNLDRPVLERIVAAVRGTTLLALLLASASLLLWGLDTGRLRPRYAATGLALLAILDLFGAGISYNPTTENLVAGFQQEWALRLMHDAPGTARIDPVDSVTSYWPANLSLLQGPPATGGGWNPLLLADPYRLWTSVTTRDSSLYDLFAPRYLVIPRGDTPPDPRKWTSLGDDGAHLRLLRNERALPRAFLVQRARVLRHTAVWDSLHAADFVPAREVLIESGTPLTGNSHGSALVVRSTAEEVVVRTTSQGPGYLVLTDSDYPGWEATVDGAATSILRADYAFRAVSVPGGSHTVTFRYHPRILYAGAAVSLTTLVGVAASWMLIARRKLQ